MARINCENCGKEYENILEACPRCGHVNEIIGVSEAAPTESGPLEERIITLTLDEQGRVTSPASPPEEPVPEVPEAGQAPAQEVWEGEESLGGFEEGPGEEPQEAAPEVDIEPYPEELEPQEQTEEFVITPHRRVEESRYRIPTWALGAICGVLGLAIIAGIIFIISNLTGLTKGKQAENTSLSTTATQIEDVEETTLPKSDTEAEEGGLIGSLTPAGTTAGEPEPSQPEPEPEPEPAPEPEPEPEELTCQSIELSLTDITLQYTGETYTFRISVLPVALAEEVVWTSSNETLVSVDENGTIVAHGGIKGETVTITAACQEKSASCIVRFGFNDDPTILELSYSDVTLTRIGETLTIEITSGLTDEERSRVVWMTDNVSAAAVDDNGVVTAIASGTANITATLDGRMGACIIRVR